MFLNIITPCSRPENLKKISESINIPRENYRWIVVCDSLNLPENELIPDNCEIYFHKNTNSISGNAQRNYAIDMVKEGHVYFNDDDTIIHQELWENIKELSDDFIHFQQLHKHGTIRLTTEKVGVNHIDSHNFIVSVDLINDTKFILDVYQADGYFAEECYKKSKTYKKIDKPLSIYNLLR